MKSEVFQTIVIALEQRAEVHSEGRGWRTRCPAPSHPDEHPSFLLYPGGGGRCFSQCTRYWNPYELAELLGIELSQKHAGLTLAELSQAKGISEGYVRSLGVTDGMSGSGKNRVRCVDISYPDQKGEVSAVHKRLSLEGASRFIWRRGDHPILYGLPYLAAIRRVGYVILVEGETDCWTLWHNRFPALGLHGASTWKEDFALLLQDLTVYVWHEPDGGGDGLVKVISQHIPELRIIEPPQDAKDCSELYLQTGDQFRERLKTLMKSARPITEIQAEAFSAEARESLRVAQPLINSPDLLERMEDIICESGYVGDVRPASMAYIAMTSRLLDDPLNVAYISTQRSGQERRYRCGIAPVPW